MAQSLSRLHVHLVFATKGRSALLHDAIRERLHSYLATIFQDRACRAILIGSMPDHVHVLFELGRTVALSSVVEDVKKTSSKWLKTLGPDLADFAWQAGYGAFAVSESHVRTTMRYIGDQAEHHRGRSFEEEFRSLLEENGVAVDERYLWD